MWWEDPSWIKWKSKFLAYKDSESVKNGVPEKRKETVVTISQACKSVIYCTKFSSLSKMLRVVACVARFIYNLKHGKEMRRVGHISVIESKEARNLIVRLVQGQTWASEIKKLREKQNLEKGSALHGLQPYLDEQELIRIGERLDYSSLSYEAKHPLIIPATHPFTKLVILDRHGRYFHARVNASLVSVKEEFWPIHAKSKVKKYLRECIICRKADPKPSQQLIGTVARGPSERVEAIF